MTPRMAATVAAWPADLRDEFEELAGKYEYDAEMPRPLAEQRAFLELSKRLRAEREDG